MKKNYIFFMLFFVVYLQSMEVKEEMLPQQRQDYFSIPCIPFQPSLETVDLKKELDFSSFFEDNLIKLQFLASILFMHNQSIQFFKNLLLIDTKTLESSEAEFIKKYCFLYDEENNATIESFEKSGMPTKFVDETKIQKQSILKVTSSEGKAVLFQFLPLKYNFSTCECVRKRIACYGRLLEQLVDHSNKEVKLIAQNVHNYLYKQLRLIVIKEALEKSFCDRFVKYIDLDNNATLFTLTLSDFLQRMSLLSFTEKFLPQLLWLDAIYSMLALHIDKKENIENYAPEDNYYFNQCIHIIIEKLLLVHEMYNNFYKKVIQEQKEILKNLKKTSSSQHYLELLKKYKKNIFEKDNSLFLLDTLPNQEYDEKQPQDMQVSCKKNSTHKKNVKKKKKRRRPHKKDISTNVDDKQQEVTTHDLGDNVVHKSTLALSIPRYDQRIIRWFDENYKQEHLQEASDLYRIYSPLVDIFIFKYGVQKAREKRGTEKTDTLYSMMGEFCFVEDNKEPEMVLFSCCKDPAGICYHRGFKRIGNTHYDEILTGNIYNIHFPPLGEKATHAKKAFKAPLLEKIITSAEYDDTQFCIYIYKTHPSLEKIILYKPLVLFDTSKEEVL